MLAKILTWMLVRINAEKPPLIETDGEYIIPIRFSEEYAHSLLTGWVPIGMGWAHIRAREDKTFDLFVRTREMAEDLNLVRLDSVQTALMASLDLARSVLESDEEYDEETIGAAEQVRNLVMISAE